jgi:diguanylate cyclase (GGDEF)-like protein
LLGELPADKAQAQHQAALVAEKIRSSLAEPYVLQSGTVTHCCTASIGVELFLGEESTEEDILKWADAAMYQAKEIGRNQVQFHEK